jgi:hypothetical protein
LTQANSSAAAANGFVIRHGDNNNQVLKIPRLFGRSQGNGTGSSSKQTATTTCTSKHLEAEKEIYERLRGVPGIANCIEYTSNGILLEYYPKGSLGGYISGEFSAFDGAEMEMGPAGYRVRCEMS